MSMSTEAARVGELSGRRLNTKAKLLAAAAEVFQELGYQATTVADIVAKADVSRATFYLYFTGKEDVYRENAAAFGERLAEDFRALDGILAGGSRQEFGAWVAEHVRWAAENQRAYVVWSEAEGLDRDVSVDVWRATLSRWLGAMPWFARQWRGARRGEAFTRLGVFAGQLQFFHHPLLTEAERRIAVDMLADMWFAQLRPHDG